MIESVCREAAGVCGGEYVLVLFLCGGTLQRLYAVDFQGCSGSSGGDCENDYRELLECDLASAFQLERLFGL